MHSMNPLERKTKLISMEERQTKNLLSRGLARLPAKISRCSEDAIYGFRDPVFLNVYGVQDLIPRNRFCQAGNRFQGSLKGLQIRALGSEQLESTGFKGFDALQELQVSGVP
jgi:hypothetical protein